MRVLHITAHLGGGAGKAVMGIACQCAKNGYKQKILLLEAPEKLTYFEMGQREQIEVLIWSKEKREVQALLEWADVAVFNWWNHPLSGKILHDIVGIPCRMVLWSHVNGCTYPFMPYEFCDMFERVFVTTTYTWDNPLWTEKQKTRIKEKSILVHGMGDFEPARVKGKESYQLSEKFTIGYAGTINFSKMHPEYVSYCKAVIDEMPNVIFLMVGDADGALLQQIRERGIEKYFQFAGYQEDIYLWYQKMDILGYLLKADNYATTENVILEAMACGLPVVTMKNPPEEHILRAGETGKLVANQMEYAAVVKELYQSEEKREALGKQARAYVCEHYSAQINMKKFEQELLKVCEKERKCYDATCVIGSTPFSYFSHFTGMEKNNFIKFKEMDEMRQNEFVKKLPEIYKGKTKSSVAHFLKYYPEDVQLSVLNKVIESNKR